MRRMHFFALLLVVLLGAAACGGGEGPGGTTDGETGGTTGDVTDDATGGPTEDGDGESDIGGDITMARANWDTGFFQAEIYYQLLEELGYNVEHPSNNQMSAQVFYESVNNRDVDVWVNGWFPLHENFLSDASNAEKVGTQVKAGAFQGYLADKATVEENDITSIEQIDDNPELAQLFDRDGNGQGDLIGCNSGWGCFESIEQHFNEGELGDNLEHVSAEYSALMSETIARHDQGEPILYYTWTPNWTVAELKPGEDVVWLQSQSHPDGEDPVPGDQVAGGAEACTSDPCNIGWEANDINVVANSDFLDQNPAAEELFKQVELTVSRISEQNAKMNAGDDTRSDIEAHAQNFIEANREKVDGWLQAARDAAGSS